MPELDPERPPVQLHRRKPVRCMVSFRPCIEERYRRRLKMNGSPTARQTASSREGLNVTERSQPLSPSCNHQFGKTWLAGSRHRQWRFGHE